MIARRKKIILFYFSFGSIIFFFLGSTFFLSIVWCPTGQEGNEAMVTSVMWIVTTIVLFVFVQGILSITVIVLPINSLK